MAESADVTIRRYSSLKACIGVSSTNDQTSQEIISSFSDFQTASDQIGLVTM